MLLRMATGLLVLALLWATFGCGGNQQGSGEQEPAQTEASTTPAKTTPGNPEVAVGQNAQLRDRTLIVNEVERNYTPTNRFPRPQSGNEFVRVNVSLTNNASDPININPTEFKLQDSNGVQRNWTSIPQLSNAFSTGSLAPGGTATGNLVFETPQDDRGIKLVYKPIGLTNESVTVSLSSPSDDTSDRQEQASETSLRQAVEDYYKAVDRKDWNYTYDKLDSQTQQRFTRSEWIQKNQYLADVDPLVRSTPEIVSEVSTSSPVEVTLTQTFRNGITRSRTTYFVWEGGSWKHRFSNEELDIFMAGTSFEEFKKVR